jgi:hypothetical protein
LELSGNDFRAGMFLSVLLLGALAFAMIRAASRLRGTISYADAFFPLVLLHWGHAENLLMGWQVCYTLLIALVGTLLLIIVRSGAQPTPKAAKLAGICLVLLPLCGPGGLAFAPPLALWLGSVAAARLRSADPAVRGQGLLELTFVLAALVLAALYFVGYRTPSFHPASPGLGATLTICLQFLSLSFGPAAASLWPLSGLVMPTLLVMSAGVLFVAWRRQPQERVRVLGLLLFLGGVATLALCLGWGRAGYGTDYGLAPRYVTLVTPALLWVYLVGCLYGPPASRRVAPLCLCALLCFVSPLNLREGSVYGRGRRSQMRAFERDVRARVPTLVLAQRYRPLMSPSREDAAAQSLDMLHRAGIGPFRSLGGKPAPRRVSPPVVPTALGSAAPQGVRPL